MNRDQEAELGGYGHAGFQRGQVDVRKVVYPAVAHECLQPDYAAAVKNRQLIQIVRHQAAPQPKIDQRVLFSSCAFLIERRSISRWRMRIKRHVKNRRGPSQRSRSRTGGESFPVGPAGFVEVNVRIDYTRENLDCGGIDLFGGGASQVWSNFGKPAAGDS